MDTGSPLEHAQQLGYRIVELVDDAFLQRDDGIFRNRDVLRAHLRATPCDVAETDAVAAPQMAEAWLGIERVHLERGVVENEAGADELFVQVMITQDVADILAQETFDALAELLDA